jgi:hypothetical protein
MAEDREDQKKKFPIPQVAINHRSPVMRPDLILA